MLSDLTPTLLFVQPSHLYLQLKIQACTFDATGTSVGYNLSGHLWSVKVTESFGKMACCFQGLENL